MTKKEILDETITFYNSTNRAINQEGDCVFENEDGKKCAVGRCLTDETLDKIKKQAFNAGTNAGSLQFIYGLDNILKEEYKGHSTEFWSELQRLHDNPENWDEFGLTGWGKSEVEEMYKTFENKLDL